MITTAEQREALQREGWKLQGLRSYLCGDELRAIEEWYNRGRSDDSHGASMNLRTYGESGCSGDLALIARAAAILGVK